MPNQYSERIVTNFEPCHNLDRNSQIKVKKAFHWTKNQQVNASIHEKKLFCCFYWNICETPPFMVENPVALADGS